MIGYLAISDAWSYKTAGGTELDAKNYVHRVHGYPHPTVFQGVRNAFRAVRQRYDYVARSQGLGVGGHVRILDLDRLPILRFEDLSLEDRRAIIGSTRRAHLEPAAISEAMLQQARDVTVPRVDQANVSELYDQLQVAERQMQIWSERCDRIRRELDDVRHMTPVQAARRRRNKPRYDKTEGQRLADENNPHAFDDPTDPTQDWAVCSCPNSCAVHP